MRDLLQWDAKHGLGEGAGACLTGGDNDVPDLQLKQKHMRTHGQGPGFLLIEIAL